MARSKYHKIGKHFKVVIFDLPPNSREGIMFNFRGRETEVLATVRLKYALMFTATSIPRGRCFQPGSKNITEVVTGTNSFILYISHLSLLKPQVICCLLILAQ